MYCPPPFRGSLFSTLYGIAWGNSSLEFSKTSVLHGKWFIHDRRRHLEGFSVVSNKRRPGVEMRWSQGQGLWDPSLETTAQIPTVSRM